MEQERLSAGAPPAAPKKKRRWLGTVIAILLVAGLGAAAAGRRLVREIPGERAQARHQRHGDHGAEPAALLLRGRGRRAGVQSFLFHHHPCSRRPSKGRAFIIRFSNSGRAAISPRSVSTARHHSKRRTCFQVAIDGFGKLYLSSWRPA